MTQPPDRPPTEDEIRKATAERLGGRLFPLRVYANPAERLLAELEEAGIEVPSEDGARK